MSYTVTRAGSNIVLKYGDDIHYSWQITKFSVSIYDQSSDFIDLGNEKFKVTLDYNNCTSPSGSTNKYDLINAISIIADKNDDTLDISRGVVSDKRASLIFGRTTSVGTSYEDIWIVGGDYNFLTGATTIEIISNNAQDDATGLGCRSILINGLDGSCNEVTEIIGLEGNGTVTTTNSFLRIQTAYIATCGTNRGSNFNDIDFQSTGSHLTLARIGGGHGTIDTSLYGTGRTQLGIYTVPAGKTLYLVSLYININSTKTADIGIWTCSNIDNITPPVSARLLLIHLNGITDYREKVLTSYFPIPEKTDIWFRGKINASTSELEVEMEYLLVDN